MSQQPLTAIQEIFQPSASERRCAQEDAGFGSTVRERAQHDRSATLPKAENILEGPMNTKLGMSLLTCGLIPVTSDNDVQGAKPYHDISSARP